MEQQENNNLSDLDQLKAQYETLKQQFDQQEIVNDRLMKSSIKRNVDFYMRYRRRQFILYPLAVVIGALFIKWEFPSNFSLMLFWITFCLVSFATELWISRNLRVKTIGNNDLLTLSNQARGFKKDFTVFTILGAVPMLILVVGWFLLRYGHNILLPSLTAFATAVGGVLVLFVVVGVAEIRYKTRPCDEIIRQIGVAEPAMDKKTGFDRTQQWFRIAMIVVFIGLDVWAYMIVASHLKLPPMWRTVEYVRATDDPSAEGKLEIWDVDADTLAISSAMINGKPMVKTLTVNKPSKYPSMESVPMTVLLTPEASQLWYQFTTDVAGHKAALVMDGVVIQDWQVMCGIENGTFFIMKEWSSKEELEAFCESLIRQ